MSAETISNTSEVNNLKVLERLDPDLVGWFKDTQDIPLPDGAQVYASKESGKFYAVDNEHSGQYNLEYEGPFEEDGITLKEGIKEVFSLETKTNNREASLSRLNNAIAKMEEGFHHNPGSDNTVANMEYVKSIIWQVSPEAEPKIVDELAETIISGTQINNGNALGESAVVSKGQVLEQIKKDFTMLGGVIGIETGADSSSNSNGRLKSVGSASASNNRTSYDLAA